MNRVLLTRALLYFGLWIVIDQSAKPANLVFGVLATIAATWTSLKLLPPHTGRVRLFALLALLPRFLWQSLVAGVDVARRAFSPRMPLHPGFIDYPVGLPRGSARNAFELIASLMPGSVPTDENEHQIEFPVVYTNAKLGTATRDLEQPGTDLKPLLDLLVAVTPPPTYIPDHPLQLLVTNLSANEYVGRMAVGRIRNINAKRKKGVTPSHDHDTRSRPRRDRRGRLGGATVSVIEGRSTGPCMRRPGRFGTGGWVTSHWRRRRRPTAW